MDLIPKIKVVEALKCVAPPTFMELDKPYPIVRAIRIMRSIIVLTLNTDDGEKLASCILSPSYSRIFDDKQYFQTKCRRQIQINS
jgi:hypothetical protein